MALWASAILEWFFTLRMSEFMDTDNPLMPEGRHPLLVFDIDPMCKGELADWGEHVDQMMIHISGSKTDWLHQGCVRPHTKVSGTSSNSDVCVARALVDLHSAYPEKFSKNRDAVFATWRNGDSIRHSHLTTLLRAAVSKNGSNPLAYSMHSLRAGRATALYLETRDIDLVARFGRWKSASISAYLWETHQMMAGLRDHMVTGGHTLHTTTINRTKLPTKRRTAKNRRRKGTSSPVRGLEVMISRISWFGKSAPMGRLPFSCVWVNTLGPYYFTRDNESFRNDS